MLTKQDMEEMAPIPGYECLYSVTKDGRIFSHGRTSWGGLGLRTLKPRWLKSDVNPFNDREMIYLTDMQGRRQRWLVYRLVALVWCPNPENKPEVNHKDGNRHHNHADNLEWVTSEENKKHAVENGFHYSYDDERRGNVAV